MWYYWILAAAGTILGGASVLGGVAVAAKSRAEQGFAGTLVSMEVGAVLLVTAYWAYGRAVA